MTDLIDEFERDVLMRVFIDESRELLTRFEETLVQLEQSPNDDELLNTIFRVAHTMKGNGATVGDEAIVEVAHAAEDLLAQLRDRRFGVTPQLITLLLSCGDYLKALVERIQGTEDREIPPATPLLEALRDAGTNGTCRQYVNQAAEPQLADATMRTSVAKLDAMLALAGEISIARSRMRLLIVNEGSQHELREAQQQLDRLCAKLETDLMRIRMVSIEPLLTQQARVVRDVAINSGKIVQLRCVGGDVEADTAVIDQLRAPLTHMVRNAVDHGIEPPERRLDLGKPEVGTITIAASHDAGMLVLEVSDDGAGMTAEIQHQIFQPGFTTAESVTEISGRGVGLDVVHQSIVELRGSITIASTPGEGTTFTIRVPLSVAIIDALAVGVGSETYVLPLDSVVECLDVEEAALDGARTGLLNVRGRVIPFVRLASCLGSVDRFQMRKSAVVVSDRKRVAALVLDRLIGRMEAVVKPLGRLPRIHGIGGATILGDGNIALILDVPRLLQREIQEVAS
ncbi:MAG TPA: chemotaxis protein CheA [Thermoanaerobaculia bacterium]|jgi:two-component system chemotaxis sensor kinase CheA|nr:chemotaxis protein CheA [Thermoanaerobaculia bacterium]